MSQQNQSPEMVSPTEAAKIFGVGKKYIDELIEKYAGPGRLSAFQYGDKQWRVNVDHLRTIIENAGVWPEDQTTEPGAVEIPGEPEISVQREIEVPDDEPDDRRYVYQILQNGTTIETWARQPRADELKELFGPGRYIIKKYDVRRNIVFESKPYNIPGDVAAQETAMNQLMNTMERLNELTGKVRGNGGGGGLDASIIKFMEVQLKQSAEMTNMLLTMMLSKLDGSKGFDEMLDRVAKIKAVLGEPEGDGGILDRLLNKAGDVIEAVAPAVVDKFSGKPGAGAYQPAPTPQNMPALPPLRVKQPATAAPATPGTAQPQQAVQIQTIKPSKGTSGNV